MHNPVWKLTSLAGVVGIGLLVVLQAQRELNLQRGTEESTANAAGAAVTGAPGSTPEGNSPGKTAAGSKAPGGDASDKQRRTEIAARLSTDESSAFDGDDEFGSDRDDTSERATSERTAGGRTNGKRDDSPLLVDADSDSSNKSPASRKPADFRDQADVDTDDFGSDLSRSTAERGPRSGESDLQEDTQKGASLASVTSGPSFDEDEDETSPAKSRRMASLEKTGSRTDSATGLFDDPDLSDSADSPVDERTNAEVEAEDEIVALGSGSALDSDEEERRAMRVGDTDDQFAAGEDAAKRPAPSMSAPSMDAPVMDAPSMDEDEQFSAEPTHPSSKPAPANRPIESLTGRSKPGRNAAEDESPAAELATTVALSSPKVPSEPEQFTEVSKSRTRISSSEKRGLPAIIKNERSPDTIISEDATGFQTQPRASRGNRDAGSRSSDEPAGLRGPGMFGPETRGSEASGPDSRGTGNGTTSRQNRVPANSGESAVVQTGDDAEFNLSESTPDSSPRPRAVIPADAAEDRSAASRATASLDADADDEVPVLPRSARENPPANKPADTSSTDDSDADFGSDDATEPSMRSATAPRSRSGSVLDAMPADSESATRSQPKGASPERLPGDPEDTPADDATDKSPVGKDAADGDDQFSPPTPLPDAPGPDVKASVETPETAPQGQPFIYRFVLKNQGTQPAYQVVVQHEVPKTVRLLGTMPQAELVKNQLIWKIDEMPAGSEKTISLKVLPQLPGVFSPTVAVNFASRSGRSPQGFSRDNLVGVPQLRFEFTAPRRAALNSMVKLQCRVTNSGKGKITNVQIQAVLPRQFRHETGEVDLECPIGTLGEGESREETLEVTAQQAGLAIAKAVVLGDGVEPVSASSQVEIFGGSIELQRTGPTALPLKRVGTYKTTITNKNDTVIRNLRIIEKLPAGLGFKAASDGGEFDSADRSILWKLPSLAPGETAIVSSTLEAKTRGSHVSVVRAADNEGASGETVATTTVTGVATLSLQAIDFPVDVAAGQEFECKIRVHNRGNEVSRNVVAQVNLPTDWQLIHARSPGNHRMQGSVVEFDAVDEIAAGGHVDLVLTLLARTAAEGSILISAQSQQMTRPVRLEEMIVVGAAVPAE